jgi:acetyl esterase/lipase
VIYSQPLQRALMFDIYQPSSAPPVGDRYPAILAIHGGGWRSYDKGGVFVPHHSYLANQGYVVFDMQYRFSSEAKWPAQLQDVQCALRWIRRHADQYAVDVERVGILGRSAGGHMGLLAAYLGNESRIPSTCEDDQDASVQAIAALYPPTDLRLWQSLPGGALYELIGGQTNDSPKAYAEASPVEYVRDNLPPTLLLQGGMDELVTPAHTELLHNLLRGTNTPSALLRIPWGRHVFDGLLAGLSAQIAQYYIDRFFALYLYQRSAKNIDNVPELPGVPY